MGVLLEYESYKEGTDIINIDFYIYGFFFGEAYCFCG